MSILPTARLLCIASAVVVVAEPIQSQNTAAPPHIVGTWLLESIVDTLTTGAISHWMGLHPTGAIIYAASGHMSVQFVRDPRPRLPDGAASGADAARLAGADPFKVLGSSELRDVIGGYYAYFGRYEVNARGDSITHFVETSLRPNEVGVPYRRAIRIDGNRLFISLRADVDGIPRHRVLTWRRAQ